MQNQLPPPGLDTSIFEAVIETGDVATRDADGDKRGAGHSTPGARLEKSTARSSGIQRGSDAENPSARGNVHRGCRAAGYG